MNWTIRLLTVMSVALFAWYLVADRITPYTSNVRVKATIIDIVPQVSGYVAALAAENGQLVATGDLLARIDPRPYQLEVERARSALQTATQNVGASSSQVEVAQANLTEAQINLENVRVQSARTFELEQKGIVAKARGDDARAEVASAEAKLEAAQSDLESAQRQLGDQGADNPQIRGAVAQLGEAELQLEWTELHAPARGGVVDLSIGQGTFARAGQTLITFISFDEVWVEAYMTENNLANISVGDLAEITLDLYPGRIFDGVVRSITIAASIGPDSGDLTRPPETTGWMRDPQRFPVRIAMTGYEVGSGDADIRRVFNGQADVIVYTSDNALMNRLGAAWIRFMSWISYAY